MNDTRTTLNKFAIDAAPLCIHISVREDENGPYVFALGLKETHTLQLRKVGSKFVVQLWLGRTAEDEYVVEEPLFEHAYDAFSAARQWLQKDVT